MGFFHPRELSWIFFYRQPLAVCVLSAVGSLKVILEFHSQEDGGSLLDSY